MADHAVTLEHRSISNAAGSLSGLAAAGILTVTERILFRVALAPLSRVLRPCARIGCPPFAVVLEVSFTVLEVLSGLLVSVGLVPFGKVALDALRVGGPVSTVVLIPGFPVGIVAKK